MNPNPKDDLPQHVSSLKKPEALSDPEAKGIHRVWYIFYLGGAMVLAIALAYYLSDGWVTRFHAQSLFFFFFWTFLALGGLLLAKVQGLPFLRVSKIVAVLFGMAVMGLLFGDRMF